MPDTPNSPPPPSPPQNNLHGSAQTMMRRVKDGQARMLRARTQRDHDVFRSLSLLGVVGWSVTFPTLAGIALGIWIDRMWPGRFSWTLTLLLAGLAIGCRNAWVHIRDDSKG